MPSKRPLLIDDYYDDSKRSKKPRSSWWHEHKHYPWLDNKPSLQGYGDMKVHKAEGRYFSRPEWGAPFVSFTKPKLQKPQLTKLPPDGS